MTRDEKLIKKILVYIRDQGDPFASFGDDCEIGYRTTEFEHLKQLQKRGQIECIFYTNAAQAKLTDLGHDELSKPGWVKRNFGKLISNVGAILVSVIGALVIAWALSLFGPQNTDPAREPVDETEQNSN